MNRHDRRAVRHDLQRLGCTCDPSVVGVPRSAWPPMATLGALINHRAGCPFGEQIAIRNKAGKIPVIITVSRGRCER